MSSVPIQRKGEDLGSFRTANIESCTRVTGADCASAPGKYAMSWWKRMQLIEDQRASELRLLKLIERERDPYTRTITSSGYGQKWFSERTCCSAFKTRTGEGDGTDEKS
jgi:hypothetical protein